MGKKSVLFGFGEEIRNHEGLSRWMYSAHCAYDNEMQEFGLGFLSESQKSPFGLLLIYIYGLLKPSSGYFEVSPQKVQFQISIFFKPKGGEAS